MDTPPPDPPWYRLPPRALLDVPALADASPYLTAGVVVGLLALVALVLVGLPLLLVVVVPVLALVVARLRTSQLGGPLEALLWDGDGVDVVVAVHRTPVPRPWDVTVTTLRARRGALELVDVIPPVAFCELAVGPVGPAGLVPLTWRGQRLHLSVIHRADPAALAPHPLNARLATRLGALAAEPLADDLDAPPPTPGVAAPAPDTPAPGWYRDPSGSPRLRFWDGARWTAQFRDPPTG